jgi:hypothetical protein
MPWHGMVCPGCRWLQKLEACVLSAHGTRSCVNATFVLFAFSFQFFALYHPMALAGSLLLHTVAILLFATNIISGPSRRCPSQVPLKANQIAKRAYSVRLFVGHDYKGVSIPTCGVWNARIFYGDKYYQDPVQGDKNVVRYCWGDAITEEKKDDVTLLREAFSEALAWLDVYVLRHTSLTWALDPRTDDTGLCSSIPPNEAGPHDAVVVGTAPEDQGSFSSTGYRYFGWSGPKRHWLQLAIDRRVSDDPQSTDRIPTELLKPRLRVEMMHEMGEYQGARLGVRSPLTASGHIMGLRHEHQRPDRDDDLEFHCENIPGYNDVSANSGIGIVTLLMAIAEG